MSSTFQIQIEGPREPEKGTMKESEFSQISRFIHETCGIHLTSVKKSLVEARLLKRLRALGLPSFKAYFEYLYSPQGIKGEVQNLIDVITTNKTEFFREPDHFSYLLNTALPTLRQERSIHDHRRYLFWSAGCSTGEEPYTLSMVLSDFKEKTSGFDFLILATDISQKVLGKAKDGIYEDTRSPSIPPGFRARYMMRSKDPTKRVVRVHPDIRMKVKFEWLNLMEEFPIDDLFDVIFCRNVIIYFALQEQQDVLSRFYRQLRPGGYLFMGHSETLTGLNLPFLPVAPTVYRKGKA